MKTYQINRLIVVAAVATLPIACGTSSPMSPDVASMEESATASAFRAAPVPPYVPQAPSPESIPVPVPSTDPGTVPAPTNRGSRRPAPQPAESDTTPNDPNSDGDAGSIPTPPNTDGDAGSIPTPPNTDRRTGGVTPPPTPSTVPAQ